MQGYLLVLVIVLVQLFGAEVAGKLKGVLLFLQDISRESFWFFVDISREASWYILRESSWS